MTSRKNVRSVTKFMRSLQDRRQVKNGVMLKKHKCGWDECPFWEKQVQLAAHQCYIQPIKKEDNEPKLKKIPASEVGTHALVCVDEYRGVWVERPPTLFVYADFEAVTHEEGLQTPIMLCLETAESDITGVMVRTVSLKCLTISMNSPLTSMTMIAESLLSSITSKPKMECSW